LLLAVVTVALGGCSAAAHQSHADDSIGGPDPRVPDEETFVHDAGRVLAGDKVSHVFRVVNPTQNTITIANPTTDLRRNCGCSSIEPKAQTLAPGEATEVRVCVDTAGRNGPFKYGGRIVWSGGDSQYGTVLLLAGECQPVVYAAPDSLTFNQRETKEQNQKVFTVRAAPEVTLHTAHLSCSSVHITIKELQRDTKALQCEVSCSPPPDMEEFAGSIFIHATVTHARDPGKHFSSLCIVPLRASQSVDLWCRPKTLALSPQGEDNQATARVLLEGEVLTRGGDFIQRVECEGWDVKWNLTQPTKSGTAILTLTFSTPVIPEVGKGQVVCVQTGSGPIRIPVTFRPNQAFTPR
jgi:hypothetical protein